MVEVSLGNVEINLSYIDVSATFFVFFYCFLAAVKEVHYVSFNTWKSQTSDTGRQAVY